MDLTNISLSNFKAFEEASLPLGKLTLLLGANSAGKSTVIQALLGVLQAQAFPAMFSANGKHVTLGDFKSISHNHALSPSFAITLAFDSEEVGRSTFSVVLGRNRHNNMPIVNTAEYSDAALTVRVERAAAKYRIEWTYDTAKDSKWQKRSDAPALKTFLVAMQEMLRDAQTKGSPTLKSRTANASMGHRGSIEIDSLSDYSAATLGFGDVMLGMRFTTMENVIESFARQFNYIGAFRVEPVRTYYQVEGRGLRIGRSGENCIEQVAAWEEAASPHATALRTTLRTLGLAEDIRSRRLTGGRFEVRIRAGKGAPAAILSDVGFGVSQLLPILVADEQLQPSGTLALSQPEIHLHPSAQANLSDYFLARVKSGRRYIIETHSEYILNRFRLRVAEGSLTPADIVVYYVANHRGTARTCRIELGADGALTGAPPDFFETYLSDVMNIAMKATSR